MLNILHGTQSMSVTYSSRHFMIHYLWMILCKKTIWLTWYGSSSWSGLIQNAILLCYGKHFQHSSQICSKHVNNISFATFCHYKLEYIGQLIIITKLKLCYFVLEKSYILNDKVFWAILKSTFTWISNNRGKSGNAVYFYMICWEPWWMGLNIQFENTIW